ncbi:hypothetical protein NDU88_001278 [Pleurodeles waltl]|uniref:Uncharacterized protein n=1 Tax=Pleurodeles waltl TaxID=8319 RepID=A0AAV7U9U9_PLEWA|nr:hypothetical protein NDU88_001278 [Pleurodeles waltl]
MFKVAKAGKVERALQNECARDVERRYWLPKCSRQGKPVKLNERFKTNALGTELEGFVMPGSAGVQNKTNHGYAKLEQRSCRKPQEASEYRQWVRRRLSWVATAPPPEAKRCEIAAAVVDVAEARNTVRCPPKGGERALPAWYRSGRNGGRGARSSWRNESGQSQRDRALKLDREERGGCEEPGGPGNTPGAQSRWALSLIPTRAGVERKPSEGRRDPLDPRECIKPRRGQRAPTGARDRHQRPGRSETGPTTEKLMPPRCRGMASGCYEFP